ncbi:hypothetical protein [Streptomyces natalensis]|uniref:Uncharacterized protein n=1 Tax=Streptomyces natalensis ATCC 27448 TaxID=1240678 RepID=A0A0D7CH82_9ACTN|nr:hypothetical protein [Streptomyces natalensis]KIZ15634.1 hypothetical protein SNA_25780 [Streptomyces natalensis ATCC 27448]
MPDIEPTPAAEFIYDDDSFAADAGELDLTTWDDVDIQDTQRVGTTQYTRGVLKGTTQERIWAEYDWGQGLRNTEEVTNSQEMSGSRVENVWNAITGPQAPTDTEQQIDHQNTVVLSQRAEELKTLTEYEHELGTPVGTPSDHARPEPRVPEPQGIEHAYDDDFEMDM